MFASVSKMSQVVATRSICSTFLCPSSGSVQDRADKARSFGFGSKVLAHEKKSWNFVSRRSLVTAKRAAQAAVVPVSPEDVQKVCDLLSC